MSVVVAVVAVIAVWSAARTVWLERRIERIEGATR